jgi:mono/diheme cytochrome c family protein
MMKASLAVSGALAALLLAASAFAQQPSAADMKIIMASGPEGARTWGGVCSGCHAPPDERGPSRILLSQKTADEIYAALTTGKMKSIGDAISESERRSISMYLTGKPLSAPAAPAAPSPTPPAVEPAPPPA